MTPALQFDNVSLLAKEGGIGRPATIRSVLERVSLNVPRGVYAFLGTPVERALVVDLLVGKREPAQGRVHRFGTISFPVGRISAVSIPVTGVDFTHLMGRLHGFDGADAVRALKMILPSPAVLDHRLDRSPTVERLALSMALSTFVDADIHIYEGFVAHPSLPQPFLRFFGRKLAEALATRTVILSSVQINLMKRLATQSLVLNDRKLAIVAGVEPKPETAQPLPEIAEPVADNDEVNEDTMF